MLDQARSRFHAPKPQTGQPQVLGEIFFPTDSSNLDQNDEQVLTAVAAYARLAAMNKRVELMIIGYADHRGNFRYNQRLGGRRAQAVYNRLEHQLRGAHQVSMSYALSRGESYSRASAKRHELARDRRVDIWDSVPDFWKPPEVPKPIIEQVERPTHISLSKDKFERFQMENPGQPDDHLQDAIDGFMEMGINKMWGDAYSAYGSVDSVRFQKMNSDWRVNNMHIKKHNTMEIMPGAGTYYTWSTDITYQWGPPSSQVVIGTTTTVGGFGKSANPKKYSRKVITRAQADRDPFTFPPAKRVGTGGIKSMKAY